MKDTELSDAEASKLSGLLHQAAEGLEVQVRDRAVVVPMRKRRAGRPWLLAAAGLLLVAAVGTTWRTVIEDSDVLLDSRPADPSELPVGPPLPAGEGLFRLPDPSSELVPAEGRVSSAGIGFQVAVDDPDQPTRWIAASWGTSAVSNAAAGGEPLVEFVDSVQDEPLGTVYRTYRSWAESLTGTSWIEVLGPASSGIGLLLAFRGVDEAAALDVARDLTARIERSTSQERADYAAAQQDGTETTEQFWDLRDAELAAAREAFPQILVPDGLTPMWNQDDGGTFDRRFSSTLFQGADEDERFVVGIEDSGLPAPVARLVGELQIEARFLDMGRFLDSTLRRRDDLAPGAIVLEHEGTSTPYLFTEDGLMVTVTGDDSTALRRKNPPPLHARLSMLRSLRSATEDELRAALAERGEDLRQVDIGSMRPDR